MLKIYVGNLPPDATLEEVTELFAHHGRVRSIDVAKDIFPVNAGVLALSRWKAMKRVPPISALNGYLLHGNNLKVNQERPRSQRGGRRR
ncbi:MAG: RNA-binding protein [Gammaproteobacteria bacterium]|nr:RNA-binding protein [Gammaproteobacteria bacterium]